MKQKKRKRKNKVKRRKREARKGYKKELTMKKQRRGRRIGEGKDNKE